MSLQAVGFDALPGWQADHLSQAMPALLAECAGFTDGRSLGGSGEAAALAGTAGQWRNACAAAAMVPANSDSAARAFFEASFQPYAILNNADATGLFTGYWEPEVSGSLTRTAEFATPLLTRPGDLVEADLGVFAPDLAGRSITGRVQGGHFLPYPDRADITGGALAGRGLELVWLRDPVDAFFLEIQGSGRIDLPGGQVMRVNYAGQNGRAYVPIGRMLADQGEISRAQMSMQAIRAWLAAHPAQQAAVMNRNPSYVFFRALPGARPDEGPPGAMGVPLTPGRSAAIDRHFLPLGVPLWIDTTDALDGAPLQRLLLAQDTGGAIRGPVRADIFFGWGAEAADRAGRMKQPGRAYVLLPRAPQMAAMP